MGIFTDWVHYRESAQRSTSRMFSKSTDPDVAMTLISACRKGVPYYKADDKLGIIPDRHKNKPPYVGRRLRTSMDDLESDLRDLGWGITKTFGGYSEDGVDSTEPSFMASKKTDQSPQEIIKQLTDLARDYEQEGVIIKLPGETESHEYKPSEKIAVPYRTPVMRKEAPYFTQLRKGQSAKNRKLVYDKAYSSDPEPFNPDSPTKPTNFGV